VLSEGDLIITMTDLSKQADTLGYPALVPKSGGTRFLHNQRLGKVLIKDKAELDRGYLYYLLCTADYRHEVLASATGTTVKHTSPSRILAYKASIPPLAEQKAIAAVLGALDDKIELNRRMNAKLEEMARALFQSWFVDFDPVRAKLDGREPVGLDSDTAAFFPEHFDHGEHDMLPVGWGLVAIEEVCAINAWTLGKYDDLETLEYVEISEVSRGNIANIANYQRGEEPSRARRRLRHGDTVLSTVRPDRGSYFLSLNPPENRVCSTGFAVLTPSKVPWSFLHVALTLPDVSDHLGQMADGGAYPAVRPEVIGAMQVSLPKNPKVLEAFHRTCAPLFEQAEANRTQSRTLATLRDTLLPKLLSGELQPTQSCPTGETLCQTT
jgi:type I restriction enzyme S subunit